MTDAVTSAAFSHTGSAVTRVTEVNTLQRGGGTRRQVISYLEAGPENAEPVLLLHGIGSTAKVWRSQLDQLSATYRVIAWNAPGYAASEAFSHSEPIVTDYVLALRGLADALRLDRVHLVGSSLGALIATEAAVVLEDRAVSLTLLAPHLGAGRSRSTAIAELAARTAMIAPGLDAYAHARVPLLLGEPDEQRLTSIRQMTLELSTSGYLQAAHALACGDLLRVAPHVTLPALVCVGSRDSITPKISHAEPAAAHLPTARLVDFPGVGHLLEVEAADDVNAELSSFLLNPGAPTGTDTDRSSVPMKTVRSNGVTEIC